MTSSDLQYGWVTQDFSLRNARLIRKNQLQDRNAAGTWVESDPAMKQLLGEEADAVKQRRFKSQRTFSATATIPNKITAKRHLFLGIREDKKRSSSTSENDWPQRQPDLMFSLHEAESEPTGDAIRHLGYGRIGYVEASENHNGGVYVQFNNIPKQIFDQIETATEGSSFTLDAVLAIRCWHWTNGFGDKEIYFETDEKPLAQLLSVVAYSHLVSRSSDLLGNTTKIDTKAVVSEVSQQLANVENLCRGIRTAAILTAVSAALLVAIAIF